MSPFKYAAIIITFLLLANEGISQPKLEINLKKPKQYQDRKLGSEKKTDKKFTFVRRTLQNTFTHYNYYFNANLKLNEIIAEATQQNKDDYTKLLDFYPYSLDQTEKNGFLDSILQKCTAGILLHDLRNDWIDNLYLVMGRAYLMRKNFDSAAMTFQFLNFSYAPKEKGGYDKPIGSNANEGGNAFSIATREKRGMTAYLITGPPSRNEAFIWQVRTLTESTEYIDASSLIETLQGDPNFPRRLKADLNEAKAYLYYRQQIWDSCASNLTKAIPNLKSREQKARWYYLAGQLYQLSNLPEKATQAYANATEMALDPVLEIYARLNSIRLRKSSNPKIIDDNIATLLKMAKKDRYTNYRDIIYYAMGLFELEREGFDPAKKFLAKSIEFNANNPGQRNLSFLLLGDIAFKEKKYGDASLPYDSTETAQLSESDAKRVLDRKPSSNSIFAADQIILLQDSLLKLAAMPDEQRTEFVRQLSKKLRKAKGLKDDIEAAQNYSGSSSSAGKQPAADLFSTATGKWYFYDMAQRTAGFQKFKDLWGARGNIDNWRRTSGLKAPLSDMKDASPDAPIQKTAEVAQTETETYDTSDVSFDNLYSRLPLDDLKKQKSNVKINNALFAKAEALHNGIEDYPEAIKVYELLLSRIDTGLMVQNVLFALIHCYEQTGNKDAAKAATERLTKQFGSGAKLPQPVNNQQPEGAGNTAYQKIYSLFLEGRFDEAFAQKSEADSIYGKYFWTPQLLYIQSIFQIKNRMDSAALNTLSQIQTEFPTHVLAKKAGNMKDVLSRRQEIETYLSNLDITRTSGNELKPSEKEPVQKIKQKNDSAVLADLKKEPVIPSKVTTELKEPTSGKNRLREDSLRLAEITQSRKDSLERVKQQLNAATDRKADSLKQAKILNQLNLDRKKDSAVQAKIIKQLEDSRRKDSITRAANVLLAEKNRLKDSVANVNLRYRQEMAAQKKDSALQQQLAREEKASLAKAAMANAALAKKIADEQKKDSLSQVQLIKQQQTARLKDSLSQASALRQAESIRQKDSIKNVQAAIKIAEAALRDSLQMVKAAADRAQKQQRDSVALMEQFKLKNKTAGAVFVTNNIVSPFLITQNGQQIVAIVLEKIDPAYVNEVMYSFNNNALRNMGDTIIAATKLKIQENSWLVLLQSDSFNSTKDAIDYIDYIKPYAKNNIISWLDNTKYKFIIINAGNLEIIKQEKNLDLYLKVLQATLPGKF